MTKTSSDRQRLALIEILKNGQSDFKTAMHMLRKMQVAEGNVVTDTGSQDDLASFNHLLGH